MEEHVEVLQPRSQDQDQCLSTDEELMQHVDAMTETIPGGGGASLDKLQLCLKQNLDLQESLHTILDLVQDALASNRRRQRKLRVIVHEAGPRRYQSLGKYWMKSWPYFVDYRMEPLIVESTSLGPKELIHLTHHVWNKQDSQKLRAGVRQKNLEAFARPIRDRMQCSTLTQKELKTLVGQVRQLPKSVPECDQYKFSADIDWEQLAYEHFDDERMGEDCRLHYKNHDAEGINCGSWSKEEERKLLRLTKEHGKREWEVIATKLGTSRTAFSCLQHYQQCLYPHMRNREWTQTEDSKLQEGIRIFGLNNWNLVANHIGSRKGCQCICRYSSTADRHKRKLGRWSADEDERLVKAVEKYGSKGQIWQRVSLLVGSRGSVQCRERWNNVHIDSEMLRPWTEEETQQLLDISYQMLAKGERIRWSEIAKQLNRRDDACMRRWKLKAPTEKQIMQKTLHVKHRECLKPNYVDTISRRRSYVTVEDIGDDLLPEKTKEMLKQYESDLRGREHKKQKRAEQEVRTPQVSNEMRSESSTSGIVGGSGPPDTSGQETSRSGCLPQTVYSSHSSSQQSATHLPLDDHQEEPNTVVQDLFLDQRDSQTGEFVSSSHVPPSPAPSLVPSSVPDSFTRSPGMQAQYLPTVATGEFVSSSHVPPSPAPSLVPSSVPDSFTRSPGMQAQYLPTVAPAPSGHDLQRVLPGASGQDDSTEVQLSILAWTQQLLQKTQQQLLQVQYSQQQLLHQQYMQKQTLQPTQTQQQLPTQTQQLFPAHSWNQHCPSYPIRLVTPPETIAGYPPPYPRMAPAFSDQMSSVNAMNEHRIRVTPSPWPHPPSSFKSPPAHRPLPTPPATGQPHPAPMIGGDSGEQYSVARDSEGPVSIPVPQQEAAVAPLPSQPCAPARRAVWGFRRRGRPRRAQSNGTKTTK